MPRRGGEGQRTIEQNGVKLIIMRHSSLSWNKLKYGVKYLATCFINMNELKLTSLSTLVLVSPFY